jgi:magnesium-transporting ATPase (P-type)
MQSVGKTIIIIGIILVIAGLIIWLFGDKLNWLGNLPGDIKIKKENFSCYMPITTMILISISFSFLLWLIRKIF